MSTSKLRIESVPSSTDSDPFRFHLYLPPGFDSSPAKRWPTILFLHGSGAVGPDIGRVIESSTMLRQIEAGRELPLVIAAPHARDDARVPLSLLSQEQRDPMRAEMGAQLDRGQWPTTGDRGLIGWPRYEKDLLSLVDALVAHWRVDPKRISLTGVSMGGYGAFYMATKHPGRWSAVAPFSGGGVVAEAPKVGRTPIWIVHGGSDPVVPVERARAMFKAIDEAGGQARFSVDENAGHDIANRYFAGKDIYDWLLDPVIEAKKPPRTR